MNFFDTAVYAAQPGQTGSSSMSLIMIFVIFIVFYFLLLRPQQKQHKQHKKMVEALGAGDEVITNGGLLGKISKVGEQFLTVKIADGVEIKVQRHHIARVLPKGTMKSA
ncbi:MAG: preprotein translocase subunit YajC [Gammaproteobacteria bacterium]|nr:preprotein translocase subunit YajC [Gammaproteobacteria bacterium]NNC96693.1 preprotein translocase subunit YajC [Gammaproteobacteria bacterium]NNM13803.1 preprotein translocase subunit YajC [Gammaproteobacteria bacterium]